MVDCRFRRVPGDIFAWRPTAIRRIGQLEFVDVVMADGTLQRRLIKTGRLGMPGRVEVLSGLTAGERVVLYPGKRGCVKQHKMAIV